MKKKILILGAYGFLGTCLSKFLSENFIIYRQGRASNADYSFNPTIFDEFNHFFNILNPDIVINTIAMTSVDQCELNPCDAFNINTLPVKNFSNIKKPQSCKLIHISTDQIYSGEGPHKEESEFPINIYGWSKMLADFIAKDCGGLVIRTNFLGHSLKHKNFINFIVDNLITNKSFELYKNIQFNPLFIDDLCACIHSLIDTHYYGSILNLGSRGSISKADIGIKIADYLQLSKDKIVFTDYHFEKSIAKRPFDMRLNIDKIYPILGYKIPTMEQTLDRLCQSIKVI